MGPYLSLLRLANDKFWETQSHCLQLHTHWWALQSPVHSSKPMATQMVLAKLSGSQNKTKVSSVGKWFAETLTKVGGK